MNDRATVVVNVFGGPGCGKTAMAWEVCERLRHMGFLVEYAPEYAKELTWDATSAAATELERERAMELLDGRPDHQMAIVREQHRRISRYVGQVDFVVTDGPQGRGLEEPRHQAAARQGPGPDRRPRAAGALLRHAREEGGRGHLPRSGHELHPGAGLANRPQGQGAAGRALPERGLLHAGRPGRGGEEHGVGPARGQGGGPPSRERSRNGRLSACDREGG